MNRLLLALAIVATLAIGWAYTVKAQGVPPDQRQQSGFTLDQEAQILMVASGTGALRYCAAKFQAPKYEVNAKTLFFDVLGPLFKDVPNRDQLGQAAVMVFQGAFRSGTFFRVAWDANANKWVPIRMPMESETDCEALDGMMRSVVTASGNPFGYGPEFKEHSDGDA